MRITLDVALFGAVFAFAMALFQSPFHAALAAIIIAGAGDILVWSDPDKRR